MSFCLFSLNKAGPRLTKVIELAQRRGEIIDGPIPQIVNMLATTIAGFMITRFVLLNVPTVSDEEINDFVRFIMNGIGTNE